MIQKKLKKMYKLSKNLSKIILNCWQKKENQKKYIQKNKYKKLVYLK